MKKTISLLSAILLFNSIGPASYVFAEELDDRSEGVNYNEFYDQDLDIEDVVNFENVDEELIEQMEILSDFTNNGNTEELKEYAESIGIDTNSDIIYIDDNQMILLFERIGMDLSQYETTDGGFSTFAAGVTKFVKRTGSKNYDVYLSASLLRNYYGATGVLGAGLVVVVGALSGGLLLPVATAMLVALAAHIKGEIKHGKIVRIRNGKISSIVNQ